MEEVNSHLGVKNHDPDARPPRYGQLRAEEVLGCKMCGWLTPKLVGTEKLRGFPLGTGALPVLACGKGRHSRRTCTCSDAVEGVTAQTTPGYNPAQVWWPPESCQCREHGCVLTARKSTRPRTVWAQSAQTSRKALRAGVGGGVRKQTYSVVCAKV
jgi:hypothetical protein